MLRFRLKVRTFLSVKLYCLFPCLSSSQVISLYVLYHKEFLSHYKFSSLACFFVKYRGHKCNMIIGLFPLPVVCGWRAYPVITAIGLNTGCPGGPLSAPDPGGPLAPSCPVWPSAGGSRLANGPVLWVAC